MTAEYDLIIIGAGSAGLSAADFAAGLGARTALVEVDHVGGDCTWVGCVPSKALLQAARVAHAMRTAGEYGLPSNDPAVDLAAVMSAVKKARARVYEQEGPETLREKGIELVMGAARFLDPYTIAAGERRLRGKHFLLCTGAEPAIPPIPGLIETPYLTYLDVYDLTELPARLAVLGGGAIGCELAQAFGRLGSHVTVLEAMDGLLPGMDPAVGAVLAGVFASEGIEVRVGARVESVAARNGVVAVATADGEVEAERLLVATGRRPRTAALDLAAAGVEVLGNGAAIKVDDRLRTSRPHIFAAGDCTGGHQFTHYAAWQAFEAVRNALLPGSSAGVLEDVPSAVFTEPEVAQVGELSGEAHEWPLARVDRVQLGAERRGLLRVYTAPDGRIRGALICMEAASELANELSVAIAAGLKLQQLAPAIHVYPTYGIALQQLAAEAAIREATSGLRGRVLKSFVR